MNGEHYACASVGDSSVFMDSSEGAIELTLGQRRKPRIDSGVQDPALAVGEVSGPMFLAADGLNVAPAEVFALLGGQAG